MSVRDVNKNPFIGAGMEALLADYNRIVKEYTGKVMPALVYDRMKLLVEAIILERDRLAVEALKKAAEALEPEKGPSNAG